MSVITALDTLYLEVSAHLVAVNRAGKNESERVCALKIQFQRDVLPFNNA
jgi:hypothetical protein